MYLALAILSLTAAPSFDEALPLTACGRSPARGVLVNRTVGSRPDDPIDPARPVVVVVHGLNPFVPWLHFVMGQRYAEVLGRQYGAGVQVFDWDWNADTMAPPFPGAHEARAIRQGQALAGALGRSGIDPAWLHLVGHSSGGLVVASAARALADAWGRPVGRITLLDPAAAHHRLIFESLRVSTAAAQVEHVWATGPSGYGRAAPYPGVSNMRLEGSRRFGGWLRPLRSDHMDTVRWHIATLAR